MWHTCDGLLSLFFGLDDSVNKVQHGTIRVHFKCCHYVIVLPDSCEWQRQRGYNGEFHLLSDEG